MNIKIIAHVLCLKDYKKCFKRKKTYLRSVINKAILLSCLQINVLIWKSKT